MNRLSNILVMVVSVRSSHTEERKQAATWEKISLHFLLVCFKHIFFSWYWGKDQEGQCWVKDHIIHLFLIALRLLREFHNRNSGGVWPGGVYPPCFDNSHCLLAAVSITQKNRSLVTLNIEVSRRKRALVCILNAFQNTYWRSLSAVFACLAVVTSAKIWVSLICLCPDRLRTHSSYYKASA